jgi:23S rRNA pseudouridine2605 synthase
MSSLIRINKLLSQAGVASRRGADDLIKEGAVALNGRILTKPGVIVDIRTDRVTVCGKEIELKEKKELLYFILNKPEGHICTAKDTHNRRTVMDLFPKGRGLFTVGRLDKDTTGVILVTNDGELSHRLMHPSYELEKVYDVSIKGRLRDKDISALGEGVDIKDKKPSVLEVLNIKRSETSSSVTVRIHEGRKRQIRRTFEALGYKVTSLKRISYGGIKIDMEEGHFRNLTDAEIRHLKKQVKL